MVLQAIAFYALAALAVLAALLVVSARNPVRSVLWLIFTFFTCAGLFVLVGAEFIAMLLVIVYVGAVAVLFLFVVMMLDINFVRLREGFLQYLPIGALIGLVLLVETGRQPIDNPDTHLELTMIHEGPLLEYAGRDLALLEWSAAARHWIVLILGAELFLPHWGGFGVQLACLGAGVALLCAALALTETAQAKMRILRAPALLAGGCLLALVGLASWLVGGLV